MHHADDRDCSTDQNCTDWYQQSPQTDDSINDFHGSLRAAEDQDKTVSRIPELWGRRISLPFASAAILARGLKSRPGQFSGNGIIFRHHVVTIGEKWQDGVEIEGSAQVVESRPSNWFACWC